MLLFYFVLGNAILLLSISSASSQECVQFLFSHVVQMFGNIPDWRPGNKC